MHNRIDARREKKKAQPKMKQLKVN